MNKNKPKVPPEELVDALQVLCDEDALESALLDMECDLTGEDPEELMSFIPPLTSRAAGPAFIPSHAAESAKAGSVLFDLLIGLKNIPTLLFQPMLALFEGYPSVGAMNLISASTATKGKGIAAGKEKKTTHEHRVLVEGPYEGFVYGFEISKDNVKAVAPQAGQPPLEMRKKPRRSLASASFVWQSRPNSKLGILITSEPLPDIGSKDIAKFVVAWSMESFE